MSAQPQVRVTPEQYLEIDRASEFKSEYYDGWIVAMAGSSSPHALITLNIGGELRERLKGTKCRPYSSDLRVRVTGQTYCYPDVPVVSGQVKFVDSQVDILLNPVLLVEVLSPSTERRDRGFKWNRYRAIETLQEYVLVSQSEPQVEIFRREKDGTWRWSGFGGLEATCRFESVGCSIPLAEIYRDVTFESELELPQ